jgi:cold shock CspA family protein
MSEESRQLGVIKFYNPRKGYGFVTRPDGTDVFFHLSHYRSPSTPLPGGVVRFTLGQNREGLTAEDISPAAGDEVEVFEARIVALDDDGGMAATPDGFEVRFRRGDFVPHSRADSLAIGDDLEMHFLTEDEHGWRAAVARPANWLPEPAPVRAERRDGDDEEESRRLLGILYKTDLDEEAQHAAELLAERNMRASLSALVSRVFDRRLSLEVRRELVDRCGQIYLDDECARFLGQVVALLARVLDDDEADSGAAAAEALRLLLTDEAFPQRWSQYLLPFGLALLRNLSAVPACAVLLGEPEVEAAAERWLGRVLRHVEQRRSGFGYVLTSAITTFDELWQRELLMAPIRRALARLLTALDAEGLSGQLYHLRDRLSDAFLEVLLTPLSQHPELPAALHAAHGNTETFAGWVEMLLARPTPVSAELLAGLLPLLQEIRARAADEDVVQRLMAPVTAGLGPEEVLRLLGEEDLPERSGWACLWHLQSTGVLSELLADPTSRNVVSRWLARAAEKVGPNVGGEQDLNTALRLVESLKDSAELRSELVDIGANLFSGVHRRLEQADGAELIALLDQFGPGELPGLTPSLLRRLAEPRLEESARRRAVAWCAECGQPLAGLATALVVWCRESDQRAAINDLVTHVVAAAGSDDPEVRACAEVGRELLRGADITWHEGFVIALQPGPDGAERAKLADLGMLLPRRLFADPLDFAVNRYVRLLLRRGLALGICSCAAPETGYVMGRLDGPLFIDDRDAVVGVIVDPHGARCWFEAAELRSGRERVLDDGDLLRFTRLAAATDQPYDYVAFNVHAQFGADDLPLLLETLAGASDEGVAEAAAAEAVRLGAAATPAWDAMMARLDDTRRARLETLAAAD